MASLTEPCSFWYGLKDRSPLHNPGCQRLFMRAFRVRSSLKKWPAPSVEHLSACSQRNKAPRRTREKTSGTQGTSARDRWQIACSRTLIRRSGYCCFKYRSNHSATDAISQFHVFSLDTLDFQWHFSVHGKNALKRLVRSSLTFRRKIWIVLTFTGDEYAGPQNSGHVLLYGS